MGKVHSGINKKEKENKTMIKAFMIAARVSNRGARIAAAAAAAAAATGGGAVESTPVTPVEAPAAPPVVQEQPTTETAKTELETKVDEALDKIDAGAADVTVEVPAPAETVAPAAPSIAEIQAKRAAAGRRRHTRINTNSITLGSLPSSKTANTVKPDVTVPSTTVVDAEIEKAVADFSVIHPAGSVYDETFTYKGASGCAAYAMELLDYACPGTGLAVSWSQDDVKPGSVVHVLDNTHWVFVISVDREAGTMKVAEGNVGGGVGIGSEYYLWQVSGEVINRA